MNYSSFTPEEVELLKSQRNARIDYAIEKIDKLSASFKMLNAKISLSAPTIKKFKSTPTTKELPCCELEEFEQFLKVYSVNKYNEGSLICEKVGVQLKKGVRAVKEHEISSSIVDIDAQECSCEAFVRRPIQGACKHIKFANFAVKHNMLSVILGLTPKTTI
jgi:hypothetical protein